MRRYGRLVIVGWYLLASTNLVYAGMDWLMPQRKTIVSANFPCAHHACGCKTAEQCRRHCCCHPPERRQAAMGATCHLAQESPKTVRVSALLAARCQGHADPAQPSLHRFDPHLPLAGATRLACTAVSCHVVGQDMNRAGAFFDPPDKIPV